MDCGTTSIFILMCPVRKLDLPHESAFTFTQNLNGQIMMSEKECRKARLLVQYFAYYEPVDKSEL